MKRLWNEIDGEPWLDNPPLFVFTNPKPARKKKRSTKMAKRRSYRKASPPRRRSTYRRRATMRAAGNPPARRRHSKRRRSSSLGFARKRSFRRNPPTIAGLSLADLLKGAGAVVLAPVLEKNIQALLPASMQGTRTGRWLVKVGSAGAVWFGADMVFGRKTSSLIALVLGANLLADATQEFVPSLVPQTTMLDAYVRPAAGMRAYTGRRGLGRVMPGPIARPGRFSGLPMGSAVDAAVSAPGRLDAKF